MPYKYGICYKDGGWYAATLYCSCEKKWNGMNYESEEDCDYKCYDANYRFNETYNFYTTFGEALYVVIQRFNFWGKTMHDFEVELSYCVDNNIEPYIRYRKNGMCSFSNAYKSGYSFYNKITVWIIEEGIEIFNKLILNKKKISAIKKNLLHEIHKFEEYKKFRIKHTCDLQNTLYSLNDDYENFQKNVKSMYDSIKDFNTNIKRYRRYKKRCKMQNCLKCIKLLLKLDMSFYDIKVKNYLLCDTIDKNYKQYANIQLILNKTNSKLTFDDIDSSNIFPVKDCYNNDIYRIPTIIINFISKTYKCDITLTKEDSIGIGSVILDQVKSILPYSINFGDKTKVIIDGEELSIIKYNKDVLPFLMIAVKIIFSDWNKVCKYISEAQSVNRIM